MTESQSNRFAELIFDIGKPEPKTPEFKRERVTEEFREPSSASAPEMDAVPEIGDVRTIQLVRRAIHVMRGGEDRALMRGELDNALAVFDRALAALLERMGRR